MARVPTIERRRVRDFCQAIAVYRQGGALVPRALTVVNARPRDLIGRPRPPLPAEIGITSGPLDGTPAQPPKRGCATPQMHTDAGWLTRRPCVVPGEQEIDLGAGRTQP